ncbi:MAG: acyltransferase family protein, partial [Aquabacterium sp.]
MNTFTLIIPQSPPGPAGTRALFLDWLRIAALGLLIVYHVGAYYARWPWHVNSPLAAQTGPWVEPLMGLSAPWRMSLLFLVSGAATACMLVRDGASAALLRARARRLLLPLLLGVLLIVAPQSYLEVRERFGYSGGFVDFMRLYWAGHGGFADARGRLILPTWNHLWFLPYLAVYTAGLWLWLRRRPGALSAAAAALPQALRGWRLAIWPLVVPLLSLLLASVFGRSHALVDDPSSHVLYASAFMLGALLAG